MFHHRAAASTGRQRFSCSLRSDGSVATRGFSSIIRFERVSINHTRMYIVYRVCLCPRRRISGEFGMIDCLAGRDEIETQHPLDVQQI